MIHTEWLKLKERETRTREVYKPWAVYNYVHCKPYEVSRYTIRADAENHKRTLQRFLPTAQIVVVFEPPGEEMPESNNIAAPDPSWDYEPIWQILSSIIFESKHLKRILAEQGSATEQGDAAISSWLAKTQKRLDEVSVACGDLPIQLDKG